MSEFVSKLEGFRGIENTTFTKKAQELTPEIIKKENKPEEYIQVVKDSEQNWTFQKLGAYLDGDNRVLKKKEPLCLRFPNHQVGYVKFYLDVVGSPLDAPAHLKLKFGEIPDELGEDSQNYQGWLSSSWIQEEIIHVDVVPGWVELPRRYAFAYMSVEILNESLKYQISISQIVCTAVTSANEACIEELSNDTGELMQRLDSTARRTLRDCMQLVFEDGPKRDRRLWIGDLRLQALVNYRTFQNIDLVKRCIYMFAGLTGADGRVGACLFYEPKMLVDDTVLFDYSLFFISCLYDYYEATKDIEFIREMWPTAVKQIRLSEQRLDKSGLLKDSEDWWCFLDWGNNLNKQAGAQGVFLYTVKQAVCLSQILEDKKEEQNLLKLFEILKQAAWTSLWDKDKELFISGQDRQVSTVSQIWMLLSGIVEEEKANSIIQKLLEQQTGIPLETPYMHHYYVEALLLYGKQNEAIHIMMEYWGGMLTEETDTFWELYNPNDLKFSPYGSNVVNSYCHAWSCTPAYFIRKYQLK